MASDRPDDEAAGEGRPKRPPPTIDLDASEVSGDTRGHEARGGMRRRLWIIFTKMLAPATSGAIAALIVVAALWAAGLIGHERAPVDAASPALAAKVNALSDRVAGLESRPATPATPVPDQKLAARVDTLEAAIGGLRSDVTALREQADAANAALSDLKSAPTNTPWPDVGALTERIARLEQVVRALPNQAQVPASADDRKLRRLAVATVLESKARHGEPYGDALAAAKNLADDRSMLAPLEAFAASGIPSDQALSKQLLTLLSQLAPQRTGSGDGSAGGSSFLGRMASDAVKLVRIERVDGSDASSPDLRVVADAARRNDVAVARAEIAKLPPDPRGRAQSWVDAVGARDTALQAATAFASGALHSLGSAD